MLISAREAAKELAGVGVPRRHARRLIACGAAGPATRTAGSLLLDDRRVAELAARPHLTEDDLAATCPWGVFIARREVRAFGTGEEAWRELGRDWRFSPWTMVWLRSRIDRHGFVPLVATVSGFVLGGAEITGVSQARAGLFGLELHSPGAWFDGVRDTRVDTPPGRPWVMLGWDMKARVG